MRFCVLATLWPAALAHKTGRSKSHSSSSNAVRQNYFHGESGHDNTNINTITRTDADNHILMGPTTFLYSATYEANAVDIWDFEYPYAEAKDSHNGEIDVCERIYYQTDDDGSIEMCCTPSDRMTMATACDMFDYDPAPDACEDNTDDYVCDGVDTIAVATYFGRYTAMDYSYNVAESWYSTFIFEDTTPPIISVPSDEVYEWDIEGCSDFDEPYASSFDYVNFAVPVERSYMYWSNEGSPDIRYGADCGDESPATGQCCFCEEEDGCVALAEIDTCMYGTWCFTDWSEDESNNVADTESYVLLIESTPSPTPAPSSEPTTAAPSDAPSAVPSTVPTPVPCPMDYEDGYCEYELVSGWPLTPNTDDDESFFSALLQKDTKMSSMPKPDGFAEGIETLNSPEGGQPSDRNAARAEYADEHPQALNDGTHTASPPAQAHGAKSMHAGASSPGDELAALSADRAAKEKQHELSQMAYQSTATAAAENDSEATAAPEADGEMLFATESIAPAAASSKSGLVSTSMNGAAVGLCVGATVLVALVVGVRSRTSFSHGEDEPLV